MSATATPLGTSSPSAIFFPNFDGLRFIAFLLVFLHHSFGTDVAVLQQNPILKAFDRAFANGELGVNFFFVLSGFLITYLLLAERQWTGRINIGRFYMRRILRIWPLYYAVVLFGFLGYPLLKQALGGEVSAETASPFYYAIFAANFNDLWHGLPDASVLGVLWSVGVEEQFYLLWAPLLWALPVSTYSRAFIAIIVFSAIFRWYHPDYLVLKYHTFSCISDMCIGGVAAYICFFSASFRARIAQLPRWSIAVLYLCLGITLIWRQSIFIGTMGLMLERLVFSLLFVGVLLEQNYCQNSIFKVGNWHFISHWGRYTYGLYCLHFIGILVTMTLSRKIGLHDKLWGVILFETSCSLVLAMGLSWLSYHYFERPFLRLKDRFSVLQPK